MWLSLLLSLAACDPPPADPPTPHGEQPAAAHAHGHGGEHDAALQLSLNDGARWTLDAHSREVLAEMRSSLEAASPDGVAGAHELAATLTSQQQRLISGCTMEGPAHEELHRFLLVWMPAVAALGETSSSEQAAEHLTALRGHLAELDRTFE